MKNDHILSEKPASKAPAIARALAILRLLGRSETALGVQAIARELDLVPSTCLYVLRALVDEQVVAMDPDTKRYRLDAGVLTLARGWLKQDRFADVIGPELERLARQSGVTMMGVQIVGLDHMIVVATAQGRANFQLSAQVGSRFPALISATGRCIAAFGDHSVKILEKRFADLRWDNPPSFEQWLAQVAQTRKNGYALDDGHYMAGAVVLAAPVWSGSDTPSHAIVAIGMNKALQAAGVETLGQALCDSAANLSTMLGGNGD